MAQIFEMIWSHKRALIALLLVIALVAPPPAPAQIFGIDLTVIVSAINAIGSAISNVIAPALRTINTALGTLRTVLSGIQSFFQNTIYPQAAINRARALVSAVQSLYVQIQSLSRINVRSATLPLPQALEGLLLSRDPLQIPAITTQFQTLYQAVPATGNASPQTRDLIDMSDGAAEAAMKRSLAIDAIADTEMQAADRINQELQQAAPGTAPMVEAEAAAWLVRANAYTQSALGDLMRLRAVALADSSSQLKLNAAHAADTRQNAIVSNK